MADTKSQLPAGLEGLAGLHRAVRQGALPLEHACTRAAQLASSGQVDPVAVNFVSEQAFQRSSVEAEEAWQLVRIGHAAADALWTATTDPARRPLVTAVFAIVCADLVLVAHAGLMEAGDLRLFQAAQREGARGLAAAREVGDTATEAALLQRRGSLVLDCYARGGKRSHADAFATWTARATDSADPELLSLLSRPLEGATPAGWPPPLEALALAEADLRAAVPIAHPERRGRVLKALAEVLVWQERLGGEIDRAELVSLCEAALADLPEGDVQSRTAVHGLLDRTRAALAASGPAAPALPEHSTDGAESLLARLELDLAAVVAETDERTAWDALQSAAAMVQETDPGRAFDLLQRQRQLPRPWSVDELRHLHHQGALSLLGRAHAPAGFAERLRRSPEAFRQAAGSAFADAARAEDRSARWRAGGALALVVVSSDRFDQEAVGLRAAAALADVAPDLLARCPGALDVTVATLHVGEGVNRERAEDVSSAVAHHLAAAEGFVRAGSGSWAVICLRYLADDVAGGRAGDVSELSTWLIGRTLEVELLAPQSGPPALLRLLRVVLASRTSWEAPVEELQQLVQAAKGRRFAAVLATGTAGWGWGEEADDLLATERALLARLPDDRPLLRPPSWDEVLDDEDLVTSYASPWETSPSDTPEGELTNVRRAVERQVVDSLTPQPAAVRPPLTLAEIRDALRPGTALLQLYTGSWVDGAAAWYAVLVTGRSERVSVTPIEMPYPAVPLSIGIAGRQVHLPLDALLVSELRREVQVEPAPDEVSASGLDRLTGLGRGLLAGVARDLDLLAAEGVDHLLVVPHGALHVLPVHLLHVDGVPLADRFVVTYLSNLAQLASAPTDDAREGPVRQGTAVFALSYADQPRLRPLASSPGEARAIATVVGTRPVLDAGATEPAVLEALQRHRRVHLRAHGQHDVDAPLFQTVFLSPDGDTDGQLRAYEVLPLDLRGLELVTLSACETALGRVDESDNLRGLPAALLLAGAGAVLGTLWEVSDVASATFFTALHTALAAGEHDLVAAFGLAQRETRRTSPEYRDWGAFYLTGGCTRPSTAHRRGTT